MKPIENKIHLFKNGKWLRERTGSEISDSLACPSVEKCVGEFKETICSGCEKVALLEGKNKEIEAALLAGAKYCEDCPTVIQVKELSLQIETANDRCADCAQLIELQSQLTAYQRLTGSEGISKDCDNCPVVIDLTMTNDLLKQEKEDMAKVNLNAQLTVPELKMREADNTNTIDCEVCSKGIELSAEITALTEKLLLIEGGRLKDRQDIGRLEADNTGLSSKMSASQKDLSAATEHGRELASQITDLREQLESKVAEIKQLRLDKAAIQNNADAQVKKNSELEADNKAERTTRTAIMTKYSKLAHAVRLLGLSALVVGLGVASALILRNWLN